MGQGSVAGRGGERGGEEKGLAWSAHAAGVSRGGKVEGLAASF